jgi:hypothetical protein
VFIGNSARLAVISSFSASENEEGRVRLSLLSVCAHNFIAPVFNVVVNSISKYGLI